jgi:hypothetical protein
LKPSFNDSRRTYPQPKKALPATEVAGKKKAGFVMTTVASSSPAVDHHDREPGLLAEIGAFWRQFFTRAFDPYRPELHYMRGPGPAWRAKQMSSSQLRSS